MLNIPSIRLNDGNKIPRIGLGLWQITDEKQFNKAFRAAIQAGYRHFDTAQAYHNEAYLGRAIKQEKVKRDEIFITTKIAVQNFGDKKSRKSFDISLKNLDMNYVDLLLLHFPVPALRKKTWRVVEDLKAEGLAKSIGVSNFTVKHLVHMEEYAKELPSINQVEMHVFLQQTKLRNYCQAKGITIEAYSPLAHAKSMDNVVIMQLADKYNKSYAQIMLRWASQKQVIIIPKSISSNRIKENISIFDFKLSNAEMNLLEHQDKNLRTCWNPELVP
jgi:diketogulonate reductase-like aldo/keto reductase